MGALVRFRQIPLLGHFPGLETVPEEANPTGSQADLCLYTGFGVCRDYLLPVQNVFVALCESVQGDLGHTVPQRQPYYIQRCRRRKQTPVHIWH